MAFDSELNELFKHVVFPTFNRVADYCDLLSTHSTVLFPGLQYLNASTYLEAFDAGITHLRGRYAVSAK